MFSVLQKVKILQLIGKPWLLAIPLSVIVIFFLPKATTKFKVVKSHQEIANKKNSTIQFQDLDNDGNDERIIAFHNEAKGKAALKVLSNKGINIDQWNFNGYYDSRYYAFSITDLQHDNCFEIYNIFYRSDSVFLGAIQVFPEKKFIFKEEFICSVWQREGEIDYRVFFQNQQDMDNDGIDELVFIVAAGFSQQPRSIFVYNSQKNSITQSPTVGANIAFLYCSDMDNDSIPEIFCGSGAPANIPDSMPIYLNDYNSWFIGYDSHFNYLFTPIKNSGSTSGVSVICSFENEFGEELVLTHFSNSQTDLNEIRAYSYNGILKKTLSFDSDFCFFSSDKQINIGGKNYYILGWENNEFFLMDNHFEIIRIKTGYNGSICYSFTADFNKDGYLEYVFQTNKKDIIIIYDQQLKNPVILDLGILPHTQNRIDFGIKHNAEKPHELFYKTDHYLYLFHYQFDVLYYFKYVIWLFVYVFISGLFWLAKYAQKIQSTRHHELEEKLSNLQMKVFKSQLDPHFMFNVLNGLAYSIKSGNNNEGYDQIVKFSQLLRVLLRRVDKLEVTIEEELNFISNYLDLEKFRFKEDFEFYINVDQNVDKSISIPRMMVQLLAENAIKHGLSHIKGLKILHIKVLKNGSKTIIKVDDNGVGRKESMVLKTISGKGMQLIEDMIVLYRKETNRDIVLSYIDKRDKNGNSVGTTAVVEF